MNRPISIAIAENHVLFRDLLATFLSKNDKFDVRFTAPNGILLLEELQTTPVDVVIIDVNTPTMDGHKTLSSIRKRYQDKVKVIILSMYDIFAYLKKYMRAGANAFLSKGCCHYSLVKAIEAVHTTGEYFSPDTPPHLIHEIKYDLNIDYGALPGEHLTNREIEVCVALCKGLSCPQIAKELCVSKRTVENHKANIFKKFDVTSCTEMMEVAIRRGYYELR